MLPERKNPAQPLTHVTKLSIFSRLQPTASHSQGYSTQAISGEEPVCSEAFTADTGTFWGACSCMLTYCFSNSKQAQTTSCNPEIDLLIIPWDSLRQKKRRFYGSGYWVNPKVMRIFFRAEVQISMYFDYNMTEKNFTGFNDYYTNCDIFCNISF